MENPSPSTWSVIALTEADVPRMVEHYMQLSREELSLRFFGGTPEAPERRREWLAAMVKGMHKRADVHQLGIVDPTTSDSLVGLASWGPSAQFAKTGEFGVSVVPGWRGKGVTLALIDHACLDAAQVGLETMRVDFRSDNSPVKRLIQSVAMVLPLSQGLSNAKLSLEPHAAEARRLVESVASFLEALGLGPGAAKL